MSSYHLSDVESFPSRFLDEIVFMAVGCCRLIVVGSAVTTNIVVNIELA